MMTKAGSRINGPAGPTSLLQQLAHHPGRDGGHLAGLGHHRVARGEGRGDLPGEQVQREVPGADQTGCGWG